MKENLKNDIRYYKNKLKEAIMLLEQNGIAEEKIRRELDLEVKEYDHIMYNM